MPLHFDPPEFEARLAAARRALTAQGLDALLMFRQESMYYLSGYDTFGYVYFQCLVLTGDGHQVLLTRAPDRRQAELTSRLSDIRVWRDAPDADPAMELRAILQELGLRSGRLGVEYEAYGLTARNGKRLEAALTGFATLVDASFLVTRLRLVKSPAEIAYVRKAAALADDALDAALDLAHAGGEEAEILARMQAAIVSGGGDDPANEFIIGSGPQALLCRYHSGRRQLDPQDQLTLEWAGVYRHYHAAMMRTIPIGSAPDRQVEMHKVARDALLAVEAALQPGRPVGEAFDAHARVIDAAGMQAARMNACGYSLGAVFAPNWMDWPMLYHGNPVEVTPGMVFFCHMIVFDDAAGLAMSLGRTSLIGPTGAEPLTRHGLDLAVG
ncbi:MAG: aminopeptidase P family protein [Rhodospirillales bacterium]|nr:aminopeptidase P family protein [Rhodospirillales bacterium]